MFYTYMHTRNDTGQPFYIGKGSGNRANSKAGRSMHWRRIVAKHGLQVHIISRWESEADAFSHERLLIASMRDINAPIINATDGGEGCSGRQISQKTLDALRSRNKGRVVSQETKEKIRAALTGRPTGRHGPPTAEVRRRISESLKGRPAAGPFDEKHRSNISAAARQRAIRYAKPVICVETGDVFHTAMDAQRWLRQNGHPKAVRCGILNVCNQVPRNYTAYGYTWKFLGEVNV